MSTAEATEKPGVEDAQSGPGPANYLPAAVFSLAALVFVIWFADTYTIWQNGHWYDVAFGLWGLYWGVTLAWGALRIRPRKTRQGIHHALLWATFAQGFFFVLFWGVGLLSEESILGAEAAAKAIGYAGFAAALAGPLLALGLAFTSRRWLVLLLAEVLGPAVFWALHRFGG